ncbi:MAG TPA: ABC transporter ATP-binding protein [Vicinamibacterales bacterium]|jgi:putative ABC transport system ATP-binding protein
MAWWTRARPAQEAGTTADAEQMPLIRLDGVAKLYKVDAPGEEGETRALDGVTLDIDRGEYVSVSGPSGCGKSTFLSILALLDAPSSGRYWFNGRRVDTLSPADKARIRNLDVGLIFQSFNLIGDMTVYENVEYPLTLRGVSAADRRTRVDAALERVGLLARRGQRPGALSGGHQQLVAIARAIAGQPPIVLADEPTGNLDSKSGEAVMQMLDELHRGGATICLATHDERHIARSHRRICLFDGRVV